VCVWFGCVCEFYFCHNCAEMEPIFDLVICHHGSLSGHRMEYIGEIVWKLIAWMQTSSVIGTLQIS
jgi:hypothetical protein